MDALKDQVLGHPDVLNMITEYLDVRSLYNCMGVNHNFREAAQYRLRRRTGIQLVSINGTTNELEISVSPLYTRLSVWSHTGLRIIPTEIIVFVRGYQSIDDRKTVNSVHQLAKGLPNGCQIHFVDIGLEQPRTTHLENCVQLTANNEQQLPNYNQAVNDMNQYIHFHPQPVETNLMALLMSASNDITVRTYRSLEGIVSTDVKCVLVFRSRKLMNRQTHREWMNFEFTGALRHLMVDQFNNQVAFGGGVANGLKHWRKGEPTRLREPYLCDPLVITIGGAGVRAASIVLATNLSTVQLYQQKLTAFRAALGFDSDNTSDSITIAYLFGRHVIIEDQSIDTIFQTVFPKVSLFAFNSEQLVWGKNYVSEPQTGFQIAANNIYNEINWTDSMALVLLNYRFSAFAVNNNIDINKNEE